MEDKRLIEREELDLEKMGLEETQLAEQLYNSAGLDPVVDAGLKDYDKHLQREDKLISKVLGPRGSDIKGYGEAVAKRVAFAIYTLLNKQYGGKVGDLRSYIMTLEEERDWANANYDELMGRVVGILGEEYKGLRTDSKEFMEKLTGVLGEDLKESRINHEALAAKLADIDGLRSQVKTLHEEKAQMEESHKAEIAGLDSNMKALESEKTALTGDLTELRKDYARLKTAITSVGGTIPHDAIREKVGEEVHSLLLKDSRVQRVLVGGMGKFVDFKKYLGIAAELGGREASRNAEEILGETLKTVQ